MPVRFYPARLAALFLAAVTVAPVSAQIVCSVPPPGPASWSYTGVNTSGDTKTRFLLGVTDTRQEWVGDGWENNTRGEWVLESPDVGNRYSAEWEDGAWASSTTTRGGEEIVLAPTRFSYGESSLHDEVRYPHDVSGDPSARDTLTFDEAGRMTSDSREYWIDGAWHPNRREFYTRNEGGTIVADRFERYLTTGWYVERERTAEVNGNGDWTTCNVWYNGRDQNWTPDVHYTRTYDGDGRLTAVLREERDEATNTLVNDESTAVRYDAEGRLSEVVYREWSSVGTWWDTQRYTLTYTPLADGGEQVEIVRRYRGALAQRHVSEYAAAGLPESAVTQRWVSGDWVNESRSLFSYGMETPAELGPEPGGLALAVAPNPAVGDVRLTLAASVAGEAQVEVFDALGRSVAVALAGRVGVGETEVALSTGRLAPGVYVVRAVVGGAVMSRTFTVAR